MSQKSNYKKVKDIKVLIDRRTKIPKYVLTMKQLELFSVMYKYYMKYKKPPALRTCGDIIWINHICVYGRLKGLIRYGYAYKMDYHRSYFPSAGAIFLVKKWVIKLIDYEI